MYERLAFLLLALVPLAGGAQEPVQFTGQAFLVHKRLMVLVDPERRLDIKGVKEPDVAARFVPASTFDDKGVPPGTYWLRLTIDNPLPVAKTAALFPPALWSEFVLYAGDEMPRRSGLEVPVSERDLEVTRRAWGALRDAEH